MKRRARVRTASIAPVRRLGLIGLLLAFTLQAYFVQTHIHPQLFGTAKVQTLQADSAQKQTPTDPMDPATCKLCREIMHAGAAITPTLPALVLLLDWVAISIPAAQLPAAALAPETGWQSRGPPTH